jgi:outer membrane protein assembly factor BamB
MELHHWWLSEFPVITDGVVYFGSDDDNVYAVQASNGALL